MSHNYDNDARAAIKRTSTLTEARQAGNTLADELGVLLSDVVTLSFRAQAAHWNVVGPNFHALHHFFQVVYEDVDGSVDPLAENIRKLGALPPARMSEFMAKRTLTDGVTSTDEAALLQDLATANDSLMERLMDAFDRADKERQQGVADFIAGRIDMHQKWAWQIRALRGAV